MPLIWAHNITDNGLQMPLIKAGKPQYVKTQNYDVGPAIVVNRITGTVSANKLRAGIIPSGVKFIAENHVNVITCSHTEGITIQNIAKQLTSDKMLSILKNITGNTQVSKTELENFLPISNT